MHDILSHTLNELVAEISFLFTEASSPAMLSMPYAVGVRRTSGFGLDAN